MIRRSVRRKEPSPEFATWVAIQKRGPLCKRWRSFANFKRDVGAKPSWAHLLIRTDTSRTFGPGNSHWRWHLSPRVRH